MDKIKSSLTNIPFALFFVPVSVEQYTTEQQGKNNEQPGKGEEVVGLPRKPSADILFLVLVANQCILPECKI